MIVPWFHIILCNNRQLRMSAFSLLKNKIDVKSVLLLRGFQALNLSCQALVWFVFVIVTK